LDGYRTKLTERDGDTNNELNYLGSYTLLCYDCHDNHSATDFESPNIPDIDDFPLSHKPHNIMFGYTKVSKGNMSEDGIGGSISGFYETNPVGPSGNPNFGVNLSAPLSETGGHYFKQDPTSSSTDARKAGDKIPCNDCHDPHAWKSDGSWQVFFRQNWPTSEILSRLVPLEAVGSNFTANDLPTGFRNNENSRKLCIACHGNGNPTGDPAREVAVLFEDIRTEYDAGVTITQTPTNVPQHQSTSTVACVSCHTHNSIEANCNGCHSYPGMDNTNSGRRMSVGHDKHVGSPLPEGTANSRKFDCETCHFGYSSNHNQSGFSAGQTWTGFDPTNVNIDFDNTWNPGENATYAGGEEPTTGIGATGACDLLYCHGNRADQSDWGGTTAATPPKWDNTVSAPCGSCHGTGAGLTNANHPAHLDNTVPYFGPGIDNATCATGGACHTAYGLSPTTNHVNNTVSFTNSSDNTFANTTVCQNCHSTALVTAIDNGDANTFPGDNLARINWNDNNYKLPCLTCHNNTSQGNTKIDGTGSDAPNIEAQWLLTGHGASSVIDNGSTNIDNQTVYQKVPVPCGMCHDVNSQHYGTTLATNAWRLRSSTGYNDANGGLDKFCNTQCHGDLPGSYALNKPDLPQDHTWVLAASPPETKETGEDTHPTARDVVSTGKTEAPQASDTMPLDNAIRQSGTQNFLCVTCHDPHGIGPSAAGPRSFTGTNPAAADNVHMLRYIHDTGSVLCKKCHI
jgi:predicted CxxxxCH...CXXCH cytochrome family protein